ncbi:uncharacterized protein LOC122896066 [Neovison vison]|uniref:uncharacterized protein LOC122896066 n=1 Tax=Neovison vison TaxID=452646 RepID=UPI001CF03AFE|nr:uncharacterized protein LOC122896066 [Neogale vison]
MTQSTQGQQQPHSSLLCTRPFQKAVRRGQGGSQRSPCDPLVLLCSLLMDPRPWKQRASPSSRTLTSCRSRGTSENACNFEVRTSVIVKVMGTADELGVVTRTCEGNTKFPGENTQNKQAGAAGGLCPRGHSGAARPDSPRRQPDLAVHVLSGAVQNLPSCGHRPPVFGSPVSGGRWDSRSLSSAAFALLVALPGMPSALSPPGQDPWRQGPCSTPPIPLPLRRCRTQCPASVPVNAAATTCFCFHPTQGTLQPDPWPLLLTPCPLPAGKASVTPRAQGPHMEPPFSQKHYLLPDSS